MTGSAATTSQRTGREIGEGLGDAERDHERQCRDEASQPEDVGREERQDRPLLADHPADERVDADEERELAEVGPEAEPDRREDGRHLRLAVGHADARRPVSRYVRSRPLPLTSTSPRGSKSKVVRRRS